MPKKLIDAIPSKIIYYDNRPYHVYKPIIITPYYCNHHKLSACVNKNKRNYHIRVFSNISDPVKRTYAVHDYLDFLVDKLNRFVEENYVGDKLKKVSIEDKYSVKRCKRKGYEYLYVTYKCNPSIDEGVKTYWKLIGRVETSTLEDINNRVKEAINHRRIVNSIYNKELEKRRNEFKKLVKLQIIERDQKHDEYP